MTFNRPTCCVTETVTGCWPRAVAHAVGRAGSDASAQPDPLFAAPEYFGGEQPGAAADVYSLGATLYAALVGSAPHAEAARDGVGALYAARLAALTEFPPAVPAALAALIARMLFPDPAERPALSEVDQVLRSLVPAGVALPPLVPTRAVPVPPRPAVRLVVTEPAAVAAAGKRRTLVAAVAIGALFLVGAGAVAATSGEDQDQADLAAVVGAAPAASPAVTPTPVPTATTPKPKKKAPEKAPEKAPQSATANGPASGSVGQATAPPRGVGMSTKDARTAGLVADRIKVFEYKDRLVVLWDMVPLAPEIVRFDLYTVPGKSGGKPIYDGTELKGIEGTYGHVFKIDVNPSRCVQIAYVVTDGAPLSDGRTTCASEPNAKKQDTAYAEAAAAHQGIVLSAPKETARPV